MVDVVGFTPEKVSGISDTRTVSMATPLTLASFNKSRNIQISLKMRNVKRMFLLLNFSTS